MDWLSSAERAGNNDSKTRDEAKSLAGGSETSIQNPLATHPRQSVPQPCATKPYRSDMDQLPYHLR